MDSAAGMAALDPVQNIGIIILGCVAFVVR